MRSSRPVPSYVIDEVMIPGAATEVRRPFASIVDVRVRPAGLVTTAVRPVPSYEIRHSWPFAVNVSLMDAIESGLSAAGTTFFELAIVIVCPPAEIEPLLKRGARIPNRGSDVVVWRIDVPSAVVIVTRLS